MPIYGLAHVKIWAHQNNPPSHSTGKTHNPKTSPLANTTKNRVVTMPKFVSAWEHKLPHLSQRGGEGKETYPLSRARLIIPESGDTTTNPKIHHQLPINNTQPTPPPTWHQPQPRES